MTNKQWDKWHNDIKMDIAVDKDLEKFLKRFYRDDKEKRKVLDVGCGQGNTLAYISYFYKHWKVYGIDWSWKALCIVNCRLKHRQNVVLKQNKADDIKYPTNEFDLCTETLLFASQKPLKVVREIHRLLKPKGRVFIKELSDAECNEDNKYIRRGKDVKRYSEKELYDVLISNNFEKVETYKSMIKEQNVEHIICIGRK